MVYTRLDIYSLDRRWSEHIVPTMNVCHLWFPVLQGVVWLGLINHQSQYHMLCSTGYTYRWKVLLTLNVRGMSYLGLTRSISCWWPGSLCRQDISSHDIDYVEYVAAGLTWGRILSTCVISMWSNDIKCKYMFMFPLKNLARKGLKKVLKMTLLFKG